jgi:hypothetical protein
MKIQSITSKECRNGKMMHTVQFTNGDYADLNIGFFGEFPFKVGDNITANIKKDKSGQYWNGYDPVIAKVASPDPLEGQKVNGVVAPAKAPLVATTPLKEYWNMPYEELIKLLPSVKEGMIHGHIENLLMCHAECNQLSYLNEKLDKLILLLEQLPQHLLEVKKP